MNIITLVPEARTAVGKVNGQEVLTDLGMVAGTVPTGKGKPDLTVNYGILPLRLHERTRKLPANVAANLKAKGRTLKFANGKPVPDGFGIVRTWGTVSTSADDVIVDVTDDGQDVTELITNERRRVTVIAPTDDKGKPYPIPLALPVIIGADVIMVDLTRDVIVDRVSSKGKVSQTKGRTGQKPVTVNGSDYVVDVVAFPILKGKRWGITTAIGR